MDNIINILKNYPFLLDMYNKADLIHIKNIYIDHVKHKRIVENNFSFIKFIAKLHELNYKPHEYSIIRYNTKTPYSEENIYLKKNDGLLKRIEDMSEIVHKNKRVALKINDEQPFQICLKHPLKKFERRIYIKQ